MTQRNDFDVVVIGGGPAGYVAAVRAAQFGMSVACIEEHAQLGGTCLRVGCIPSKSLLESSERFAAAQHELPKHGILVDNVRLDLDAMQQRKTTIVDKLAKGVQGLLVRSDVEVIRGRGQLAGPGCVRVCHESGDRMLTAKRIIIAAGSKPASLPGVEIDGEFIGASSTALAYDAVPSRLIVIGGGYIGLELGSLWNRLGADVTVIETLDRTLAGMDREIAALAQRSLQQQGLSFRLGTKVNRAVTQDGRCNVELDNGEQLTADRVLLAVGRVAATDGLNLQSVGVEPNEQGEVSVNQGFQTSAPNVYAIGDCIRGPKLAHKASHEAIACVDQFAGASAHVNYDTIPAVVYIEPQLASVGKTEEQLKASDRSYQRGMFPFQASGRAATLGTTEGIVKVLADSATDRILGVHVFGPRAGDLIAEAAAAMDFGASAEDLAHVCHAHPTLSESLGEAALDVANRAIHLPVRRKR